MLYDVATLTVRVVPRSSQPGVTRDRGGEVVVRVTSPPADGRATEEARRLLAGAVGVARSAVTLRLGARSRSKTFDVGGLSERALEARVQGIPPASEA